MTSIRGVIKSKALKAKKHGRLTFVLPDDVRTWLKGLPDAGREVEADVPPVENGLIR
jgi:hypothetical protein